MPGFDVLSAPPGWHVQKFPEHYLRCNRIDTDSRRTAFWPGNSWLASDLAGQPPQLPVDATSESGDVLVNYPRCQWAYALSAKAFYVGIGYNRHII